MSALLTGRYVSAYKSLSDGDMFRCDDAASEAPIRVGQRVGGRRSRLWRTAEAGILPLSQYL